MISPNEFDLHIHSVDVESGTGANLIPARKEINLKHGSLLFLHLLVSFKHDGKTLKNDKSKEHVWLQCAGLSAYRIHS